MQMCAIPTDVSLVSMQENHRLFLNPLVNTNGNDNNNKIKSSLQKRKKINQRDEKHLKEQLQSKNQQHMLTSSENQNPTNKSN